MDYVIPFVVTLFFGSFFYFIFESSAIYFWINRQGCSVSFFYSSMPGKIINQYYKWCNETGTSINIDRIKRYDRALKALGFSFVIFVTTLITLLFLNE